MKIAVPATLIGIGLVALIVAGIIVGGIPEMQVAQLLTSDYEASRTLKVHGILADIESDQRPLKFTVADKADPEKKIKVECDRTRPDTFQVTYDVAVQGTYDADRGVFVAEQIYTKCPSKYEAEDRYKAGTETPEGDKPLEPSAAIPDQAAPEAEQVEKPAPAGS